MRMSQHLDVLEGVTPTLMTIRELRKTLGVSRSSIYRWIETGKLRRVGKLQAPSDYNSQRVVLLELIDNELIDRVRDHVKTESEAGKRPIFLTQRLALAALADLPDDLPATEIGDTEPSSHFVEELEIMLGRLGEERAARHVLVSQLEEAARRLREDPKVSEQTQALEEVLVALQSIRAKESALLEIAQRDDSENEAQPDESAADDDSDDNDDGTEDQAVVELGADGSEVYELTPEEDALDEEYLANSEPDPADTTLATDAPTPSDALDEVLEEIIDGAVADVVGVEDAQPEATDQPDHQDADDDEHNDKDDVDDDAGSLGNVEESEIAEIAEQALEEPAGSTPDGDEPTTEAPNAAEPSPDATAIPSVEQAAEEESNEVASSDTESSDTEPEDAEKDEGGAEASPAESDTTKSEVEEPTPPTVEPDTGQEPTAETPPTPSNESQTDWLREPIETIASNTGAVASGILELRDGATKTSSAVLALGEHLSRLGSGGTSQEPDDEVALGLVAAGAGLILVSWVLALWMHASTTPLSMLALLLANGVACIAVLKGRQRVRQLTMRAQRAAAANESASTQEA